MKTSIKLVGLAALIGAVPCAVKAQAVINVRTLSFAAAHEAARVGLETCRKNGYAVTVTVLDSLGRTKVVLHDDGANPHTV